MKHSDLQKVHHANYGVVCSGNRLCRDCQIHRKRNKRMNNRTIRRINKGLTIISKTRMDDEN